jgi:hypothetical protein
VSTVSSLTGEAPAVPLVTVTRGAPTPAELAAVLAVLLTARPAIPAGTSAERPRASRWTERSRARVTFPRPGQHAWRASARPY